MQNQNEIFVIHSVNSKLPLLLYKLHTYGDPNDVISGSFYEFELTPTVIEEFYIEKIIKKRKNQILVKWLGYKEPTWEPREYIEKILDESEEKP